jgi:hypothetical protein
MTADTLCGYPSRDEALVSYLYDELDGAQRSAFDTHLVLCARCRSELEQLSGVRTQLSEWEAPAVVGRESSVNNLPSSVGSPQSAAVRRQTWWREIPAWAQIAAAVLCLGVGAGLANLNVRYDHDGLSIQTGWLKQDRVAPNSTTGAAQDSTKGVAQNATTGVAQDFSPARANASAPWRADLAALEQQLRTEWQSANTAPAGVTLARSTRPSMSDAELLKRVRALVDESERRQNRELALRVGEMARDVHTQRQADLRKIDQSLEYVLSNTGLAVAKQQQTLNYLVSRTSSQK